MYGTTSTNQLVMPEKKGEKKIIGKEVGRRCLGPRADHVASRSRNIKKEMDQREMKRNGSGRSRTSRLCATKLHALQDNALSRGQLIHLD